MVFSSSGYSEILDASSDVKKWQIPPSFRLERIALPLNYFMVGLVWGFFKPVANVWPIDIGANEAQQSIVETTRHFPATFKILFGFLSDARPFLGYRRKGYMGLGWLVCSLSMLALVAQGDTPPVPFMIFAFLIANIGIWFTDVMADSLVAELAKFEDEHERGQLQSTCYASRQCAEVFSTVMSTLIYRSFGPVPVVYAMALLPLVTQIPLIFAFRESKPSKVPSVGAQCKEIWSTVCSRAVWQPMAYVYLAHAVSVGTGAWKQFSRTVLGFTSTQLNGFIIESAFLHFAGIMVYKYFFMQNSWRNVYIVCLLIKLLLHSSQLFLITDSIPFGLSPYIFAMGDDLVNDTIAGILFLPTCIMMAQLCPKGSEGVSYAMFTSVSAAGRMVSEGLKIQFLKFWDVSKETMASGDLSGLLHLKILTITLQFSPIFFVFLLPHQYNELMALHNKSSRMGGFIFLSITLSSILYSAIVNLNNIFSNV